MTMLLGIATIDGMEQKYSKLQEYILATVAYYDGFSYPLTAFEIWKNLVRTDYSSSGQRMAEVSLAEIFKQLQGEQFSKQLESVGGFYFLKGREGLIEERIKKQKISAGKLKRLSRVAYWLRTIPFIRMIGVTGGLAMKNAHSQSDWDLLIVIAEGHIWTGRTLVTIFTQLIGKRRYGKKIINRVCLNYFVTDASLEVITKDLFSANEYMFLIPLFGENVYRRFQIKNQWIKAMKPSYNLSEIARPKILGDSFFSKKIRNVGEFLFGNIWVERFLENIEKRKIFENPKTHQEGSLVYAGSDALIFLPVPHGPVIFERFKEKMDQLGIGN